MTRRRAASFIEIAQPNGQRYLIETPGQLMIDAVLKAIGIKPSPPIVPERRFVRAGDEPATPGQAQAFREAAMAIRGPAQ